MKLSRFGNKYIVSESFFDAILLKLGGISSKDLEDIASQYSKLKTKKIDKNQKITVDGEELKLDDAINKIYDKYLK